MMAEGVVDAHKCGSYVTGWLTTGHPSGNDCISINFVQLLGIHFISKEVFK